MRTIKATLLPIAILLVCLFISGCATVHRTHGTDFDTAKVSQIVKGKTTANQVLAIFGAPFSKQPFGADNEQWVYYYADITAHAHAVPFGGVHSTATGTKKKLYITINKSNVVVNYVLDEGPIAPVTQSTHQY